MTVNRRRMAEPHPLKPEFGSKGGGKVRGWEKEVTGSH